MIELVFLASLRERVRRQQAEERVQAAEPARFVPVTESVATGRPAPVAGLNQPALEMPVAGARSLLQPTSHSTGPLVETGGSR
jgi:hypothetical protein